MQFRSHNTDRSPRFATQVKECCRLAFISILSLIFFASLAYAQFDDVDNVSGDTGFSFYRSGKKKNTQKVEENIKQDFLQNKVRKEAKYNSNSSEVDYGLKKKKEVKKSKENTFTKFSKRSAPLIVIDPGHGGDDHGAIGYNGVSEKDVVLNISLLLERILKNRLGVRTELTRRNDKFIALDGRTNFANEKKADLFISIHTNASERANLQGIETYYLDNTNDKSSLKLASRENASGLTAGNDLDFILSDLIQTGKLDDSVELAHYVQDSLIESLSFYYEDVVSLGVKKAPFYVLVGAHMPCILVEVSFIDHELEGKRLASQNYQVLIAQAIYEGVGKFFQLKDLKNE